MWYFNKFAFLSIVAYDPTKDPGPKRFLRVPVTVTDPKTHKTVKLGAGVLVSSMYANQIPREALKPLGKGEFDFRSVARNKTTHLLVRGRVREHVEDLRKVYPKLFIADVNAADYRYRTVISRKLFKKYAANAIDEIDYGSHFKEEMSAHALPKDMHTQLHSSLMGVWSEMMRLQPHSYSYYGNGTGKTGKYSWPAAKGAGSAVSYSHTGSQGISWPGPAKVQGKPVETTRSLEDYLNAEEPDLGGVWDGDMWTPEYTKDWPDLLKWVTKAKGFNVDALDINLLTEDSFEGFHYLQSKYGASKTFTATELQELIKEAQEVQEELKEERKKDAAPPAQILAPAESDHS